MFMVVMQYIPGTSLLRASLPLPAPDLEAVRWDIKQALNLLHVQDLVFGDLWEANVLYLPEDGGCALLVDFDGVCQHGMEKIGILLVSTLMWGLVWIGCRSWKSHMIFRTLRGL